MKKEKLEIYDYIIFGGTPAGLAAAVNYKREGKTVLLLNSYGFLGGSITESLNCLQNIEPENISPIVQQIISKLKSEKFGILGEFQNSKLVNPESIKFIFQNISEEENIDLLFHISAKKIEQQEHLRKLTLLAKEGEISFKCHHLIDATWDHQLTKITNPAVIDRKKNYFNFITTSVNKSVIFDLRLKEKFVELNDSRFWVSSYFSCDNPLFIDDEAQRFSDKINEFLMKNNSRIQVLPAKTLTITGEQKSAMLHLYESIDDKLDRVYYSNELFVKASDWEKNAKSKN